MCLISLICIYMHTYISIFRGTSIQKLSIYTYLNLHNVSWSISEYTNMDYFRNNYTLSLLKNLLGNFLNILKKCKLEFVLCKDNYFCHRSCQWDLKDKIYKTNSTLVFIHFNIIYLKKKLSDMSSILLPSFLNKICWC